MLGRWRRALHRQDGYTLMELSLAMALSSIIFASLVSVIYSFSQQAGDSGQAAMLQQTSRELVADLVVELRQAEKVTANGYPIEELTAGKLVAYTDRLESEGPERVVYERKSCIDDMCELWVTRYPAVPGTGPWWTFSTTPVENMMALERVSSVHPLFAGSDWVGDPPVRTYIASCSPSGTACDFPLVVITFRASPTNTSAGADRAYEIEEEVRLRNG
ncbi:MAG: prepilin-type N-terminal cleavage/methylation domain-containing protein [Actinobacteria bacterium]|nr:prepilin-type N-terminal cleavage/methylation domain-containing protein [Actinomycetota bacterium]MBU1493140.1 prepilin-type N-terminal cleavage/methylation domain-containing protein [Actinomycetota bacterium]